MDAPYTKSLTEREALLSTRFDRLMKRNAARLDHIFFWLFIGQFILGILIALFTGTYTWSGDQRSIHPHLWVAIGMGGLIIAMPLYLTRAHPGSRASRLAVAISMGMMTALLIHLSNGRTEVHFHAFVSVALLAYYRDIHVIIAYTIVASLDHFVRAPFYPELVFGEFEDSPILRSLEHSAWLLAAIIFIVLSISRGRDELRRLIENNLKREELQHELERRVLDRTRELKSSEERAKSLFHNAPTGLFRLNANGDFMVANPVFLSLCGYSDLDTFLEREGSLRNFKLEDSFIASFEASIAQRRPVSFNETVWQVADQEEMIVKVSLSPFIDAEGQLLYIEGCCEDITQQKELEDCYLQSQKMQSVGLFAGGIAHDFNNLLGAVEGFTELIRDANPKDETQDFCAEISKAVRRGARLTHQLLAFSRKDVSVLQSADINEGIEDFAAILRSCLNENIELDFQLADELPGCRVDVGKLQQLILNLVINARDAIDPHGRIIIRSRFEESTKPKTLFSGVLPEGEYTIIEVEDNGGGIPADALPHIFDPFFTTKTSVGGHGLGLFSCLGIAHNFQGEIDVKSTEGGPTIFSVYIPAIPKTAGDVTPSVDSTPVVALKNDPNEFDGLVLLVEDEPSLRLLGEKSLEKLGFEVVIASNGVEGLEEFDQIVQRLHGHHAPAFILMTDIMMPKMDGVELSREVRRRRPETAVLFYSGYTNELVNKEDLYNAPSVFLSKPYSILDLKEKIRDLKRKASPAQESES